MRHLLSKKVLNESMFGFALPYAKTTLCFLEAIKVDLKSFVSNSPNSQKKRL